MGMKQGSYVLGWLLTNLFKCLFVSVIYLSLAVGTGGFNGKENCTLLGPIHDCNMLASPGAVIGAYIVYFLSTLAMTYLFTTFFQHPRTATDITLLV
jgi:hypothetical protein